MKTNMRIKKMITQKQLIIDYIEKNGSIIPNEVKGTEFKKNLFGNDITKRCNEMVKEGFLSSKKWDKNRSANEYFIFDKSQQTFL